MKRASRERREVKKEKSQKMVETKLIGPGMREESRKRQS